MVLMCETLCVASCSVFDGHSVTYNADNWS